MHGFTQEQRSPKPLQQQPFSGTAPYKHSSAGAGREVQYSSSRPAYGVGRMKGFLEDGIQWMFLCVTPAAFLAVIKSVQFLCLSGVQKIIYQDQARYV